MELLQGKDCPGPQDLCKHSTRVIDSSCWKRGNRKTSEDAGCSSTQHPFMDITNIMASIVLVRVSETF